MLIYKISEYAFEYYKFVLQMNLRYDGFEIAQDPDQAEN